MKFKLFTLLLLSLLVNSCTNNKEKEHVKSNAHLPLNERIKLIYAENKEEKIEFEIKFDKLLKELYTKNKFEPLWIQNDSLTPTANILLSFFDSTELYGLHKDLYPINELKKSSDPLQIELGLTESLFRVIIHLNQGVLDSNTTVKSFKIKRIKKNLSDFLFEHKKDTLIVSHIIDFQPKHFQYRWLQNSWANYYRNSSLDSTKFEIPTIKEDSLKCYAITRKVLFHRKYMDSTGLKDDEVFIKALEQFQRDHALKGDHVIGTNTIIALEKTEYEKFQQIILALERHKWKQDLPEKYFRVNIPEQKLRLIDSNRVIRERRVIVGHEDTQTPELKSRMRRIVLYPFWNVPHSISSTEILYGAKRDTGFMRKKNYKVFRGKKEVDPKEINWKKYKKNRFPFRIRQEPGPKNSLGLIKFLFPNEHSVYLHDTPTKWLFRTSMRYYSHGCMRMENPQELAHYLIATDPKNKFIADSLEVEMAKEERQSIYLRKPIPIFVEYISVVGDSTGNIIFYNDHYNRDKKYIDALFQKD